MFAQSTQSTQSAFLINRSLRVCGHFLFSLFKQFCMENKDSVCKDLTYQALFKVLSMLR